jgi:hypothetical protein
MGQNPILRLARNITIGNLAGGVFFYADLHPSLLWMTASPLGALWRACGRLLLGLLLFRLLGSLHDIRLRAEGVSQIPHPAGVLRIIGAIGGRLCFLSLLPECLRGFRHQSIMPQRSGIFHPSRGASARLAVSQIGALAAASHAA